MIHSSAIISPEASLGSGVRIGPGVMIEAGCVVGEGCEIRAHAIITGGTTLGARNQIGYGAIIGAEPQDLTFKNESSRVVIGDDNVIREYVTIHRGTKMGTETVIGSKNFLMAACHVAHNCRIGSRVVLVNNVLLAGHVEVHDGAFLGGGAAVHQFVRIGAMAIMRGQTRIGKDLPPFFMAVDTNQVAGLNRVGLKRGGFSANQRRNLQQAYNLLYRGGLNVSQALDQIEKEMSGEEITMLVQFIRGSKRGICKESKDGESAEE